jgi:hypothetical protein
MPTTCQPPAPPPRPTVDGLLAEARRYRFKGQVSDAARVLRAALALHTQLRARPDHAIADGNHGVTLQQQKSQQNDLLAAQIMSDLGSSLRVQLTQSTSEHGHVNAIEEVRQLLNDAADLRMHELQKLTASNEGSCPQESDTAAATATSELRLKVADSYSALAMFEHAHGDASKSTEYHRKALTLFSQVPLVHGSDSARSGAKNETMSNLSSSSSGESDSIRRLAPTTPSLPRDQPQRSADRGNKENLQGESANVIYAEQQNSNSVKQVIDQDDQHVCEEDTSATASGPVRGRAGEADYDEVEHWLKLKGQQRTRTWNRLRNEWCGMVQSDATSSSSRTPSKSSANAQVLQSAEQSRHPQRTGYLAGPESRGGKLRLEIINEQ